MYLCIRRFELNADAPELHLQAHLVKVLSGSQLSVANHVCKRLSTGDARTYITMPAGMQRQWTLTEAAAGADAAPVGLPPV